MSENTNNLTVEKIKEMQEVLHECEIPPEPRYILSATNGSVGQTSNPMRDKTPDEEVAETMVDVGDINALMSALDGLCLNERALARVYRISDHNFQAAVLNMQGALHIAKLRLIKDLEHLGVSDWSKDFDAKT